MVDCDTGDWAEELLGELGLPAMILPPIVPPGTQVGALRSAVADATGLPASLKVVAPASHDTASAVAAVPSDNTSAWCFLSSGTWSLLGAEIEEPCVSAAAQEASFTNELGIAGTIRFLKNIPGLWLVQECRRDFARRGQEYDYAKLTQLAAEAEAFHTIVDPAHTSFQSSGEMPRKIAEFAKSTGQPAPEGAGAFVRACLESLALAYRDKLETLESILGQRFDIIHVVGGGGKNELLNQMTADATGRRVIVGPFEATATVNILVQALALGDVPDVRAMRRIVAKSSQLATYEPSGAAAWEAAWDRYEGMRGK
jgi:rhamnulokinase